VRAPVSSRPIPYLDRTISTRSFMRTAEQLEAVSDTLRHRTSHTVLSLPSLAVYPSREESLRPARSGLALSPCGDTKDCETHFPLDTDARGFPRSPSTCGRPLWETCTAFYGDYRFSWFPFSGSILGPTTGSTTHLHEQRTPVVLTRSDSALFYRTYLGHSRDSFVGHPFRVHY